MHDEDVTTASTVEKRGRAWGTRRSVLALAVATAAIGLTACGGGSPGSPRAASLGKHTDHDSARTTTAQPTGNATALLNEWADCMRSHGDPSQADPTIDVNKVIHIAILPSVPGGLLGPNGQSGAGPVPGSYCATYLTGAINALQGDQQAGLPSQSELEKYAQCMRVNGVPDFPDPGGVQLSQVPGSDMNPRSPSFEQAGRVCTKKTGVSGPNGGGPLPPGTVVSGPPGQQGMPTLIAVGNDAGG